MLLGEQVVRWREFPRDWPDANLYNVSGADSATKSAQPSSPDGESAPADRDAWGRKAIWAAFGRAGAATLLSVDGLPVLDIFNDWNGRSPFRLQPPERELSEKGAGPHQTPADGPPRRRLVAGPGRPDALQPLLRGSAQLSDPAGIPPTPLDRLSSPGHPVSRRRELEEGSQLGLLRTMGHVEATELTHDLDWRPHLGDFDRYLHRTLRDLRFVPLLSSLSHPPPPFLPSQQAHCSPISEEALQDTVLILQADHGTRYGPGRLTKVSSPV